ncbi:MAG TPA: hypothetical protein VFH68_00915 [Polyangia bacterium]|jgi:hypothetical protein|nr:hypothetical protein [Polyangia bacterium]
MTTSDPPLLDADVRALLKRTAGIDPAPAGARMRVETRVLARILESGVRPAAGGPGDGSRAGTSPGTAASVFPAIAAPSGLARRLVPLAVSFALGGGVGGFVVSRTMRPVAPSAPAALVQVARPIEVVRPDGPTSNLADPPAGSLPASGGLDRSEAPASARSRLAAERTLLDVARGALERGKPRVALAATTRHERVYRDGVLAQEREAMAIRALVMLDRLSDARQRAARFRARFPGSVLWPAIESIIGASHTP